MVDGEVIEADPPHKLVQTWRMVMDEAMAAEGFTRLTYEIAEGKGGVTKLTVIHELEGAPQARAADVRRHGGHGRRRWLELGAQRPQDAARDRGVDGPAGRSQPRLTQSCEGRRPGRRSRSASLRPASRSNYTQMSATEATSKAARTMLTTRRVRSCSTSLPNAAPPAAQIEDEHTTMTMIVPVSKATPAGQGRSGERNVPTAAIEKIHAFGLTHWNVTPCHTLIGCETSARPTRHCEEPGRRRRADRRSPPPSARS